MSAIRVAVCTVSMDSDVAVDETHTSRSLRVIQILLPSLESRLMPGVSSVSDDFSVLSVARKEKGGTRPPFSYRFAYGIKSQPD